MNPLSIGREIQAEAALAPKSRHREAPELQTAGRISDPPALPAWLSSALQRDMGDATKPV
jgi:hypothetical protein